MVLLAFQVIGGGYHFVDEDPQEAQRNVYTSIFQLIFFYMFLKTIFVFQNKIIDKLNITESRQVLGFGEESKNN